jgi:hypothetical protein
MRGTTIQSEGTYQRQVSLFGNRISLAGEYAELLTIRAGEELTFDQENALQIGKLRYWSPEELPQLEQRVAGESRYDDTLLRPEDRRPKGYWQRLANRVFSQWNIIQVIWGLIIVSTLIGIGRRFFQGLADSLNRPRDWITSFGLGLLTLIVLPMLSIFGFVSILGMPLAILGFGAYGVILLLSTGIISVVLSFWLNKKWELQAPPSKEFMMAWGIYCLMIVISASMPLLGGLIFIVSLALVWGFLVRRYIFHPTSLKD